MATEKKDYYETLGVSKNATDEEISKAYKKLAMKLHPDRQVGKSDEEKKKSEEAFKEVNEAYAVLHDKDKRAQYDQFGFEGPQGFSGFGSGFNPFDIFRQHFSHGMFDDDDGFNPFGFHHQRQRQEPNYNAPESGADFQMQMSLKLSEALHGCVKDIDLTLDKECPDCHGKGIADGSTPTKCEACNGTGQVVHVQRNGFMMSQTISPCPHCHGEGIKVERCKTCHGEKRIPHKKTISVKIPQGMKSGSRVRVKGAGQCGIKGGKDGNMYIVVNVTDTGPFEVIDNNIAAKIPIDPVTASLGGKKRIKTPWSYVEIDVPRCAKSGSTVRVPKHGLRFADGRSGDFIAVLDVVPLTNLSEDQKKMMFDLQKSLKSSNVCGEDEYEQKANAVT